MTESSNTFHIVTLGCKVNQYESQAIRESWTARGYRETEHPENASILLVNSCAVTSRAMNDVMRTIRRLHRDVPGAEIIVTGCAAQAEPGTLGAMEGVSRVVSQRDKTVLTGIGTGPREEQPGFPPLAISDFNRARAVLKVQDGCSHRCTYCIIPLTRGKSVSRPPREVITEAGRLFAAGVREITLCGINLRQFGRDLSPHTDFWDLVRALDEQLAPEWAGRARLRISSLEPADLTDKALRVLSASRLVCPHLHISLQSGSRSVLKRMGRGHYTPDMVTDFLVHLHDPWPIFALGADILMGFPGETEEEFLETLDFCRTLPLSYAHVFPFSPRPGTAAAGFRHQIPEHLRRERAKAVREAIAPKRREFLKRISRLETLDVVLEQSRRGMCQYYVECRLTEEPEGAGPRNMIRVRPTGVEKNEILATPLAPQR
jgi:MiaB-like tRNA modifying enzyme